jgi:dipeptidyl-peptidase-3
MQWLRHPGIFIVLVFIFACGETDMPAEKQPPTGASRDNAKGEDWRKAAPIPARTVQDKDGFLWQTEQFADVRILRYRVPGWEKLTLQQKKLAYYLTQAGLAGRDILWDQHYRNNLALRDVLESIYTKYPGDRTTLGWQRFETYLKRVWFANGIHHHYSMTKFKPEFSLEYLNEVVAASGIDIEEMLLKAIFDPGLDVKRVELDPAKGLLENSAVNFYEPGLKTEDVTAFYQAKSTVESATPLSWGLNATLVRNDAGELEEHPWRLDGLYGEAIAEIVAWLERAVTVAENEPQAAALQKLIEYYRSGDLADWDEYNVLWVQATEGDIDYINGFVEVYSDPLGYHGSYETIVQIKDAESSERLKVLMDEAAWFETHSPILPAHRRENVVGITYKVVNAVGEAGDSSPSTPVGVNLPNANWIRDRYGSKSVSLGNIEHAYHESAGTVLTEEFANDQEEIDRDRQYSAITEPLHTALHEVIGHASGKLEEGVGTPADTLKNYASALEEGRADLVALYFIADPKLLEWGLLPSAEAAWTAYDSYIRGGLMVQLRRVEPGADIEEAHMRNRAFIARWVMERGKTDNVIVATQQNGRTSYDIRDYERLRELFGELLREVQRIKSQGDYPAAQALVENYGVKIDPGLHKEVLERAAKLDIAPYAGFINPELHPVVDAAGEITDIEIVYPDDFAGQMLAYSRDYGHLAKEDSQNE